MARSGGCWRDLPARLGDYETVKRRYYRWIEMGFLDDILAALAREADLEWLMFKPEGDEDHALQGTDLKERFYDYLVSTMGERGRLIIIENQHPPSGIESRISMTVIHP